MFCILAPALQRVPPSSGVEVTQRKNGDKVLTFVLNHNVHHRGQLTVYLRLAGASVPALYGPSADESV